MSSFLEYRHAAIVVDTTAVAAGVELPENTPAQLYVVLVEGGDSNVTTMKRGRDGREREVLARKWMLAALGSHEDVMERVASMSASAESGGVCMGTRGPSGEISAEQYIRKYRRLLTNATGGWDGLMPLLHAKVVLDGADEALAQTAFFQPLAQEGRIEPYSYERKAIRLTPQANNADNVIQTLAHVHALTCAFPDVSVSLYDLGYVEALLQHYQRRAA